MPPFALPLTAIDWLIAWSRLPDGVLMNGAKGHATSTATRVDAMKFDLKLLAGVLIFATLIGVLAGFVRPERATLGAAVVLMCAGLHVFLLLLNGVLCFAQVP